MQDGKEVTSHDKHVMNDDSQTGDEWRRIDVKDGSQTGDEPWQTGDERLSNLTDNNERAAGISPVAQYNLEITTHTHKALSLISNCMAMTSTHSMARRYL